MADRRQSFLLGLRDSAGVPALGITGALVGYGVMAREAGLDIFVTVASVVTIWAMPVLMAFVELASSSASPLLALVTLFAIAFRNLPMSVSAIPMIRHGSGFRWSHILMAQLLSPTSWVQITVVGRRIEPQNRMAYYTGFSLVLLAISVVGVTVGYSLTQGVHPAIGLTLLFLTPLFVLLTMATSPKLSSRLALIAGGIGVPLLMEWDAEWGLIAGGFGCGTLGFLLSRVPNLWKGKT